MSEVSAALACQPAASASNSLRTRGLTSADVADGDHEVIELASQNLESASERREIRDVPIDDDQLSHREGVSPLADLHDHVDQGLRLQRERSGPAPRMPSEQP